MNWDVILSSAAVGAAVSAIGAVISSAISKRAAIKAARITATAEIEKVKIKISSDEKIHNEDRERRIAKERESLIISAIEETVNYREMSDPTRKVKAETAISNLLMAVYTEEIEQLLETVQKSDPFTGPDKNTINTQIANIQRLFNSES